MYGILAFWPQFDFALYSSAAKAESTVRLFRFRVSSCSLLENTFIFFFSGFVDCEKASASGLEFEHQVRKRLSKIQDGGCVACVVFYTDTWPTLTFSVM